jgi:C-terminal processing protease CtpA/Prc
MDEPLAWSREQRREFYWHKYLEDSKTIYCQYRACRSMPENPIDRFSDELLELVESRSVDRFILDIRHNTGGNSLLLEPLIAGLRQSRVNEQGRLFCLIGRRTFSSAVLNAISLRRNTEALFVGEPTGGKPNHFGEVRQFTLPFSRLQVSYSTKYFTHSDQDTPSFMPDILVDMSPEDYFTGKDPVLETALTFQQAAEGKGSRRDQTTR